MRRHLFCLLLTTSLLLSACRWPEVKDGATPSPTPTVTPPTEVNITVPHEGGKVKQTEMVKGTSRSIAGGQVIWVVVFVHKAGMYYPQNQPADIQANGDWTSVTYFGVPTDVNMTFDAIAVLADQAGQKAFNTYLGEARNKNDYPGLERLPDGVKIYSRVSVTRQ